MNRKHSAEYEEYLQSEKWQWVRHRILSKAGGLCERCRTATATQVHHLTYVRLGNELDSDLQALCEPCHEVADRQRAYSAAFRTYAAKRWGEGIDEFTESDYEEFDNWLEAKAEEHW